MKTSNTKKTKEVRKVSEKFVVPEAVAAVLESMRSDFRIVMEEVSSLKVIVNALAEGQEILLKKFDKFELEQIAMKRDLNVLTDRVGALEQNVGSLKQKVDSMDSRLARVEQDVHEIKDQLRIATDKETVVILERRVSHLEQQVASLQAR